jgi:hypothetical protein
MAIDAYAKHFLGLFSIGSNAKVRDTAAGNFKQSVLFTAELEESVVAPAKQRRAKHCPQKTMGCAMACCMFASATSHFLGSWR